MGKMHLFVVLHYAFIIVTISRRLHIAILHDSPNIHKFTCLID